MNLLITSRYPVINIGLSKILKNKYNSITSFLSLDDASFSIEHDSDNLLIYTLFKENPKTVDDLINFKLYNPEIKMLIIDFNQSKDLFFRFSKVKTEGYLFGDFFKEDIEYAIHKISTGSRFYDRELLYKIVDNEEKFYNTTINTTYETSLSTREKEILYYISSGLSNAEISSTLTISENTVKKHISNIFMKINVKDRTQATIYAYDVGLVNKSIFAKKNAREI